MTILSGMEVRFLQDRTNSGEEIKVEITLSSPARKEIDLLVQLGPGRGRESCGARRGLPRRARLTSRLAKAPPAAWSRFQLLRNSTMTEARSLGVTVSLVGA